MSSLTCVILVVTCICVVMTSANEISLTKTKFETGNTVTRKNPEKSENIGNSDNNLSTPVAVSSTPQPQQAQAPSQQNLQRPVQPASPDCYRYFPGTPGWNECFNKFTQDMALYQMKMHDYVKETTNGSGVANISGGSDYSESSYSDTRSTANSYVGGYGINAINMALSTSLNNGFVKIILNTGGPIENFERQINGNEIIIRMTVRGQPKQAKIMVPQEIKTESVKIDKTFDTVYMTAPAVQRWNDGNLQLSQSMFGGSTSSFSNNFQGYGAAPMLPVALPNFGNMFHNIFHNIHSMFQGQSKLVPQYKLRQTRVPNSYYPEGAPMWY